MFLLQQDDKICINPRIHFREHYDTFNNSFEDELHSVLDSVVVVEVKRKGVEIVRKVFIKKMGMNGFVDTLVGNLLNPNNLFKVVEVIFAYYAYGDEAKVGNKNNKIISINIDEETKKVD